MKDDMITIKHHSTSSTVQIKVISYEPDFAGEPEEVEQDLWLDYSSFNRLKQVLATTEIAGLDWEAAMKHHNEVVENIEHTDENLVHRLTIGTLFARYESGERSPELYRQIMAL